LYTSLNVKYIKARRIWRADHVAREKYLRNTVWGSKRRDHLGDLEL
jgi:hypothetical protein